ncbi:hypothetical protein [Comamonas testosteroni]|uniref:hypothetical protein n=1 Tax=Comamonas testosteroni TaxID=285 RepID=UPI0005B34561|nr:hypothetical protein [Comamonas testosteroni]
MNSSLFYSLPVTILRRASIQFLYGLTTLGLTLYAMYDLNDAPDEFAGVVSSVSVVFDWLMKGALVLGVLSIVLSVLKGVHFRRHVLGQRREFEHVMANKETMITSDIERAFKIFQVMMAYEYELERSFYDANVWRQQLMTLGLAMLKIACFMLVMMIASNIIAGDFWPGVAVGSACIPPWLMFGPHRPRNQFVLRAERAYSVKEDELDLT